MGESLVQDNSEHQIKRQTSAKDVNQLHCFVLITQLEEDYNLLFSYSVWCGELTFRFLSPF